VSKERGLIGQFPVVDGAMHPHPIRCTGSADKSHYRLSVAAAKADSTVPEQSKLAGCRFAAAGVAVVISGVFPLRP